MHDISGIALFLDFKKAFDSLEWNFIIKALETFGFGAPLIQWVKIFYKNIQSCVINNGYATSFELHSTMIGKIKDGGLNMPNFKIINKSLKAGWVKRFLNPQTQSWKIPFDLLH